MKAKLWGLVVILAFSALAPAAPGGELLVELEKKYRQLEKQSKGERDRQVRSQLSREISEARRRLEASIERGELGPIQRELAAGLDPSEQNSIDFFEAAVCANQVGLVRSMIRAAGNKSLLFSHSSSTDPWACVAANNDPSLALAVLEAGPGPDWTDAERRLVISAGEISLLDTSQYEIVSVAARRNKKLLARGLLAGVRSPGHLLQNVIVSAANDNDPEQVRRLLALDEDRKYLSALERGEILRHAARSGQSSVVEILVEAGAEVSPDSLKLLAKENPEVVIALASHGLDRWTALRILRSSSSHETFDRAVDELLYAPQGRQMYRETPEQIAKDLLAGGFDARGPVSNFEARGARGRTGLIAAAAVQDYYLVELYVKAGAKVDAQDDDGATALFFAAKGRYLPLMTLLRNAGASSELRTKKGTSAAEAFWAGTTSREYRTDGSLPVGFRLPSDFEPQCTAPAGRGLLCRSEVFETELVVEPRRGKVARASDAGAAGAGSQDPRISLESKPGSDQVEVVAQGSKAHVEVRVEVRSQAILEPEAHWLAESLWRSVTPPPTPAQALQGQLWGAINDTGFRVVVGGALIVFLLLVFVLARRFSN